MHNNQTARGKNKDSFSNLRFEVTTKCEFKCSHCHVSAEKKGINLDYDVFLKTLNSKTNSDIKKIRISGGEPSLWPFIYDAVSECLKRKIKISINTVEPSLIRKLAELTTQDNQIQITTTLNSANSYKHDEIVGQKGHFDAILSSIDYVNQKISVDINYPLTCDNIKNVFELHNLLLNRGVKRLCLNRLYPAGRAKSNKVIFPTKEELKTLILDVLNRNIQNVLPRITFANAIPLCIVPNPEEFMKYNEGPLCKYGRESITISADGKPHLCVAFPWWDRTIDQVSIKSLYDSKAASNWRNNKFLPKVCKNCKYLFSCRGGCRLAALEASELIDGHDPLSKHANNSI